MPAPKRSKVPQRSNAPQPSLTDTLNVDIIRKVLSTLENGNPRDYYALANTSSIFRNNATRQYPATSLLFSNMFKRFYESTAIDSPDSATPLSPLNQSTERTLVRIDKNIRTYKKRIRSDPAYIYLLAVEYDTRVNHLSGIFAKDRLRSIPLYSDSYYHEDMSAYISLELKKTYLAMLFLNKDINRKDLIHVIDDFAATSSNILNGIACMVKGDHALYVCFLYMRCYHHNKHSTDVDTIYNMYRTLLHEYAHAPHIFKIPDVRQYHPPATNNPRYVENRRIAYNACIDYFLTNRTQLEDNAHLDEF